MMDNLMKHLAYVTYLSLFDKKTPYYFVHNKKLMMNHEDDESIASLEFDYAIKCSI